MLTHKEIEIIILRKKGLKQTEISEKLRLSQPAISKFETNAKRKIKDAEEIVRIAKSLGLTNDNINDLLNPKKKLKHA